MIGYTGSVEANGHGAVLFPQPVTSAIAYCGHTALHLGDSRPRRSPQHRPAPDGGRFAVDKLSDLFHELELLEEKIAQAEATIAQSKSEMSKVKDRMRVSVGEFLEKQSVREARQIASDLYWSRRMMAGLVKDAYKQATGNPLTPFLCGIGLYCKECGGEITAESWSDRDITEKVARSEHWIRTCDACRNDSFEKDQERLQQQNAVANNRLDELAAMRYADYLQTPEWQARRTRALRAAGYRCQVCNSQGELHVHHRTYERRGREYASDLTVLCADCHRQYHGIEE